MLIDDSELEIRVKLYCNQKNRTILDFGKPLGWGTDGRVWETTQNTAIKLLRRRECFDTELACYRRFLARNVSEIRGFTVPQLVDFDRALMAIEMTLVAKPYIIDFAKCQLDRRPDFSQTTMADWHDFQSERWGKYWPTILRLISALEGMGIYYSDPNLDNIAPPKDWDI